MSNRSAGIIEKILERWEFFKGVLFGVYGNWFISYIEKISFNVNNPRFGLQLLLLFISMFTLLLFFFYTVLFTVSPKHYVIAIVLISALHTASCFFTLFFESTTESMLYKNYYFAAIGFFFLGIIAVLDYNRHRLEPFRKN